MRNADNPAFNRDNHLTVDGFRTSYAGDFGDKVAIRDPLTLSGTVAMWPLVRGAATSFP